MSQYARTMHCRRHSFVIATQLLVLALGGLWFASAAHATRLPTIASEPQQRPLLLAMMDDDNDEMGMGAGMKPGMGAGKSGTSSPGMSGMDGMGAMGAAPGAGSMAMPSALPGFPGASHLYHVGATGFFLDYADKLGLSMDQSTALNGIKQRALLDQSSNQRKVDEAEQALWMLTAADQPDAASIEAKIREIEKLNSDERISFIRAVGEAAKKLSAEQQKMVLGLAPMPGTAPMKSMTK